MAQVFDIIIQLAILVLLVLQGLYLRRVEKRVEGHEFYLHTHPYKVQRIHKGVDPYAGRGTDVPNT